MDLWNHKTSHQREVVTYALDGSELNVHMQFSIFPAHETNWDLVLMSMTDIIARKKAEAYLEYIGTHDVVTGLYNRSFYVHTLERLQRLLVFPVAMVVADLNGLKKVNDEFGHTAGDMLLRRTGEILTEAVIEPNCAARIGGDEFAIVPPGGTEDDGLIIIATIQRLVEVNNRVYSGGSLSLSLGTASAISGERLEAVFARAIAICIRLSGGITSSSNKIGAAAFNLEASFAVNQVICGRYTADAKTICFRCVKTQPVAIEIFQNNCNVDRRSPSETGCRSQRSPHFTRLQPLSELRLIVA